MSDQDLWPGEIINAPTLPTPVAQPTQDAESYRAGLESLINNGAARDVINQYIVAHGVDPARVQGIDEARAAVAAGHQVRIPVNLTGGELSKPAQGSDRLWPGEVVPHTYLDEAALGARHALTGATQLGDMINSAMPSTMGAQMAARLMGEPQQPTMTQMADQGFNAIGLPQDQTDGERLAGKVIEGATGGLLTGGEAPIASLLSGAGAGGGSELARQHGAGGWGQLAAGLAGGLVAPGSIAAGGRMAESLPWNVDAQLANGSRELSPVAQAFARQDVPALAPDVGGIGTRMISGAINSTLGGIPLREAAQASVNAARAARDRITGLVGNAAGDNYGLGAAAKRGAQSFLETTKTTAGKLYDAIPIGGKSPAMLDSSKAKLAELTAGLESNPMLSKILEDPQMQRIADGITGTVKQVPTGLLDAAGKPIMRDVQEGGALTWQDLKAFRSRIGEKAGAPALQSDTPQANLKALYGALSDDMAATAQAQGPKAYAAFQRANTYWRARQQRVDDVITPILGNDGANTPDDAARAINSWVNNKPDFIRTAQALRSMPEDEADTIRATVFSKLGNAKAGAQDVDGKEFSPSVFATQWQTLKEKNPRALSVLFPGKQYQDDISDLVAITNAQKGATKFANTSHSTTAKFLGDAVSAAAGVAGGVFTGNFGGGMAGWILSNGSQFGVGKLLASPTFTRWLASSVKKPNAAAQLAHINRLTAIAAKQPAIANDVLTLQEQLAGHFTGKVNPFAGPQPIAAQTDGGQQ